MFLLVGQWTALLAEVTQRSTWRVSKHAAELSIIMNPTLLSTEANLLLASHPSPLLKRVTDYFQSWNTNILSGNKCVEDGFNLVYTEWFVSIGMSKDTIRHSTHGESLK